MQHIDLKDILHSGAIHLYVLGLADAATRARVKSWKKRFPELEQIVDRTRKGLCARFSEASARADRPEVSHAS